MSTGDSLELSTVPTEEPAGLTGRRVAISNPEIQLAQVSMALLISTTLMTSAAVLTLKTMPKP